MIIAYGYLKCTAAMWQGMGERNWKYLVLRYLHYIWSVIVVFDGGLKITFQDLFIYIYLFIHLSEREIMSRGEGQKER